MLKKNLLKHKALPLLILLLLLASLTAWQWLQVTQLGHHWRQLPQRSLATPLADYAELQAVRLLQTEDGEGLRQLVDELASARLVKAAQLYASGGQLLAESGSLDEGELPYIRQLYQNERPVGFLRLQLAPSALTEAQHSLWQQLQLHLRWLLPLCALLGIFAGLGLRRRPARSE